MKRALSILLLVASFAAHSESIVGIDIGSVHVPARAYQHNFNPGVYFKSANGFTAGIYHNTLGRVSMYAGLTIERGPFALTAGIISGYQKHVYPDGHWEGSSPGYLTFMLSPSVRLPVKFMGVSPRISYVPGIGSSSSVFHLSLEHPF